MQRQETDAAYFARRAREEADLALRAERPDVAAAHRGLSRQYADMAARLGLTEDEASKTPFFPAENGRDAAPRRGDDA